MTQSLEFSVDAPDALDRLRQHLSQRWTVEVAAPRSLRQACLETFDWRLWRAGLSLWLEDAGETPRLRLQPLDPDAPALLAPAPGLPVFAGDLPAGTLRRRLAPLIDMRALLVLFQDAVVPGPGIAGGQIERVLISSLHPTRLPFRWPGARTPR